jgi:hypothetical protein
MTNVSCETVLQAAVGAPLRNVLVIGELSSGQAYVATSSNMGIGDALLLMERAKQHLLAIHESYRSI